MKKDALQAATDPNLLAQGLSVVGNVQAAAQQELNTENV